MLYTSDHGENIFDDDGSLFLHAGQKASRYELHVPLLVWTSDSYNELFPSEVQALQANRERQVESSVSTFHTLLQLGGVHTPVRADSLSLASGSFEELRQLFVNDDFKQDYRTLNTEVRKRGYNIPPLVNAYMGLSPTMRMFGTAVNHEFGEVEETRILMQLITLTVSRKLSLKALITPHNASR